MASGFRQGIAEGLCTLFASQREALGPGTVLLHLAACSSSSGRASLAIAPPAIVAHRSIPSAPESPSPPIYQPLSAIRQQGTLCPSAFMLRSKKRSSDPKHVFDFKAPVFTGDVHTLEWGSTCQSELIAGL